LQQQRGLSLLILLLLQGCEGAGGSQRLARAALLSQMKVAKPLEDCDNNQHARKGR
jgi:hypothetical protein